LKLLLSHGGNPNLESKGIKGFSGNTTPLLLACTRGNFDYVKLLVEAGANVNYKTDSTTMLYEAATSVKPVEIVSYLVEKGIDYKQPVMQTKKGKKIYLADAMRYWHYRIGSNRYKEKMKLVAFLKQNGIDYRKTPIPEEYLPRYSKEYLDMY
jgi:hypothetical protein